jgi:hypothetical protein
MKSTMSEQTEALFCDVPRRPTAKIWRYVEFEKLLDYLERKALFFSCADRLGDELEGSLPPGYDELIEKLKSRKTPKIPIDEDKRLRAEQLQLVRRLSLVSSWHLSEHESYAMWRLFMSNKQGVAIQTTVGRFQSALQAQSLTAYLCRVNYLHSSYVKRNHHLSLLTNKDAAFSYEREVRAIIDLYQDLVVSPKLPEVESQTMIERLVQEGGYHIPIEPQDLIDRIVISPGSQNWFKDLVRTMLKRYGLSDCCVVSKLERPPLF